MPDFAVKQSENSVEIASVDGQHTSVPQARPQRRLGMLVVAIIAGSLLIFGIRSRVKAETSLRGLTSEMAILSVSVVRAKPTAPEQEIILPGNIQPFISSPVYARTDGYLKKWYFDIG